ncbi:MAG: ATP-grasp domain-containing protein [Bacteroidota bacterium]
MKVLITGLFTQAGIFAIRRFGKMGYDVTAADNHILAFGMYSKYVKKRILLPSLRKNPLGYAEAVLNELKKEKYDFYFPSFEELFLMSNFKEQILQYTQTIIPDYKEIINVHDKSLLKKVVLDAKAFYPETFIPESYNHFLEIAEKIDFPVYIKIRQSRNSTGLRLVEDPANIKSAYDEVIYRNNLEENQLPIIQRKINGPEIAYSALAQNGKIIGQSQHVGVRSIPRSGGTTVCRTTVNYEVCNIEAAKFISSINWTGIIGMDFKIDEQTNKAYIIDVNPRASVCVNVAYYGGADLIPEWIKIANGKQATVLPEVKIGIKSSTHFADVMWFLYTYMQGPESWSERRAYRKEWWKNRKEINYDIIDKDDWRPRWVLNTFLFFQIIRMVFTKLEASNLFLYYNVYIEETYKQQLEKSLRYAKSAKKLVLEQSS